MTDQNDPSYVDKVNNEYRRNPAAADAPPPPRQRQAPTFTGTTPTVLGAPEPEAPQGKRRSAAQKRKDAVAARKAAAQARKDERDAKLQAAKRKRQFSSGQRFGGRRFSWWVLGAALVVLASTSVVAIIVAVSKPSRDEIAVAVEEGLSDGGRDFPTGQAVMWAGQVLRTWGTWSEDSRETRALALTPYLSAGMDPQTGWNGRGDQTLIAASLNPEPEVTDANHATIHGAYQIQDGTWRCIALPVYAYNPDGVGEDVWAFALAANPTPMPCAPRTGAPTITKADMLGGEGLEANEEAADDLAADFFPGFFTAWAASDSAALNQYTASGVQTIGLGGAMATIPAPEIGEVVLYTDEDGVVRNKTYYAYVPVTWTITGSDSKVLAAYIVPVKLDGARWTVAGEPQAAQQGLEASGSTPATVPNPADDVTPIPYNQPTPEPTTRPTEIGTEPSAEPDADPTDAPVDGETDSDQ